MPTMTCRVCGQGDSIAFCSETGDPLCAECAVTCQVCKSPISSRRVKLTSTGRKLCSKCMAQRNARRQAKKEEMRREKKRVPSPAPAEIQGAGLSFQELNDGAPPQRAGTSFEDLRDGPEPVLGRGEAREAVREPGDRSGASEEKSEGRARQFGIEGDAREGGGRLQLPPIDEDRPILTSSGYQPPSKLTWIAAFAAFGIAGAIFWTVFPGLRDIMLPADLARPKFLSNLMPFASDTNTLRNTANINQFEIFKQGPIFIIAWLVVGSYCLGFFLIIVSTIRSLISSYFAKRRLKRAEEYAEKYGQAYPQ